MGRYVVKMKAGGGEFKQGKRRRGSGGRDLIR